MQRDIHSWLSQLGDQQVVILDGANGTEVDKRLGRLTEPLWVTRALLDQPEVLLQIHEAYVQAGAQILTANTFRTHARSLESAGLADQAKALTELAVQLARQAAGERAYVAGSLAPLEDCYAPENVPCEADLQREHRLAAAHLAAANVDLILVETQGTIREAVAACAAAKSTGRPTWLSLLCRDDGNLLSGESLDDAASRLRRCQPDVVGVNCVAAPAVAGVLQKLNRLFPGLPLIAYGNTCRRRVDGSWEATAATSAEAYADFAAQWVAHGAHLIGGCCGTTPAHIAMIARRLPRAV